MPPKKRAAKKKEEVEDTPTAAETVAVAEEPKKVEEPVAEPAGKGKGKRAKPAKREESSEEEEEESPQYWKEVFICGTEWDSLQDLHKVDWDFSHLDKELTEGQFSGLGEKEKVFIFGGSEPQMVEVKGESRVIPIPVMVVIKSTVDLPEQLGLNSVQMEKETIEPMSKFKMGWQFFDVPETKPAAAAASEPKKRRRGAAPARKLYVLKCSQRGSALKQLSEERVHRFDYCMPYVFLPHKVASEPLDTSVEIICNVPGRTNPLLFEFDWDMDDVDDFVEEKVKDEEDLPAGFDATLKQTIKDSVAAAKTKRKAERDEKRKVIAEIPEEVKEGLKNMRKYKYYPCNKTPDVSALKSPFINRYYGQASAVF